MRVPYLLKYHELYFRRIQELKERIRSLKERLSPEEFGRHEVVKLALRLRRAELEIAQDPDRPEYWLRGDLRRFRRYKRGLGRYRIFFCFSQHPPIILFLYFNTEGSLRKEGGLRDPYEEFKAFLSRGQVSHDPGDPKIQRWVRDQA